MTDRVPAPDEPRPDPDAAGEDLARPDEVRDLPPVSADFVARVAARVATDHERITAEAARVDDEPLPAGLLARFVVPEPSRDFVARTVARVLRERAAPDAAPTEEAPLRPVLARYALPPVSADFVERTFDALRIERSPLRIVGGTRRGTAAPRGGDAERSPRADRRPATGPAPRGWRRLPRARVLLAAAALVLVAVAIAIGAGGSGREVDARGPSVVVAADTPSQRFSPIPVNTAFARRLSVQHAGLRYEPADPLLLLAHGGER